MTNHNPQNKDCPQYNGWGRVYSEGKCTCHPLKDTEAQIRARDLVCPQCNAYSISEAAPVCPKCGLITLGIALKALDKASAENAKLESKLLLSEYNHLEINRELRADIASVRTELEAAHEVIEGSRVTGSPAWEIERNTLKAELEAVKGERDRYRKAIENAPCDIECANDQCLTMTNNYMRKEKKPVECRADCWRGAALQGISDENNRT
jgi:hypothetical protein